MACPWREGARRTRKSWSDYCEGEVTVEGRRTTGVAAGPPPAADASRGLWLADPYSDWPARYPGRRAVGYFCSYAPLEILHAAGLTPLRLFPVEGTVAQADAVLPPFSCALARSTTERLLLGELSFVEAVLFVHTCDTMQCLADIWRMAGTDLKVINFPLPAVLSARGARELVQAGQRELLRALEDELGRHVTDESLRASVALYNEQRRLLSELYAWRDRLPALRLWQLSMAGFVMPVEDHISLLQQSLSVAAGADGESRRGPRLAIVGTVLHEGSILDLIEELGGQVVADDLCTGERYLQSSVELHEDGDPQTALVERTLARPVCPAKRHADRDAPERLVRLARSRGAQGVVFVLPRYCDPCGFDSVLQRRALDTEGIPHLTVETELTQPTGQLRTRLQAFLELLSPG